MMSAIFGSCAVEMPRLTHHVCLNVIILKERLSFLRLTPALNSITR